MTTLNTFHSQNFDSISLGISNNVVVKGSVFFLKYTRIATHSFKRWIALCVSIPVLILVYLLLRYINRKLRQSLDGDIQMDIHNYKRIWNGYVNFDETARVLKKLVGISASHSVPWHTRLILRQLAVASKNLINYHSKISQKIVSLDTPYCTLPNNTKVVTTEELWKNRVRGYDFLV